jgi:hypothetical protein
MLEPSKAALKSPTFPLTGRCSVGISPQKLIAPVAFLRIIYAPFCFPTVELFDSPNCSLNIFDLCQTTNL